MTENKLQLAGEKLAAFYEPFAAAAAKRESQLGRPVENCPTAADLQRIVNIFRELAGQQQFFTVSEVNKLMESLVEVSDKWVDLTTT